MSIMVVELPCRSVMAELQLVYTGIG